MSNPLMFPIDVDIQPVLEEAQEGALDDVTEHVAVFFPVLLDGGGMGDGHDRIGIAFETAHPPVFLFGEPDIGDEVQVWGDAEPFVRPDVKEVLVRPIFGVHAFE